MTRSTKQDFNTIEHRRFRKDSWRLSEYNGKSDLLSPFLPTQNDPGPLHVRWWADQRGITLEEANRELALGLMNSLAFSNGCGAQDYRVVIEELCHADGWETIWLSIRRWDGEAIRDWRHLQEIKNMIVGPEYEAIELYPAEERVVDEANQSHLFVFANPGFRLPVGYLEGSKDYDSSRSFAPQRPRGF